MVIRQGHQLEPNRRKELHDIGRNRMRGISVSGALFSRKGGCAGDSHIIPRDSAAGVRRTHSHFEVRERKVGRFDEWPNARER